ncbi:MAG: hypothetical protein JWP45_3194 [Mucilaginibacter sp.]|nr:hypothetical protein [Mucilaginibacter sp.]
MMRKEAPMEPNILCCLFYKQVAPIGARMLYRFSYRLTKAP